MACLRKSYENIVMLVLFSQPICIWASDKVSISPTCYEHIFHTNLLCPACLSSICVCIFLAKETEVKKLLIKKLVKLTKRWLHFSVKRKSPFKHLLKHVEFILKKSADKTMKEKVVICNFWGIFTYTEWFTTPYLAKVIYVFVK